MSVYLDRCFKLFGAISHKPFNNLHSGLSRKFRTFHQVTPHGTYEQIACFGLKGPAQF
jgi:hypothetical protein